MLLAEDLLLLLLDDDSGANQSSYMQVALGGALLVELAMDELVDLDEGSRWRCAKVAAADRAPAPEDPLLADALATVADRPRTAPSLVERLGKRIQEPLAERLVERGILARRDSKVLGLFPRTRWPMVDATHEDGVRRSLEATLIDGQEPDARTGALIALLLAVDRVHKSVDRGGLTSGDVKRRAKEIAEGDWAAQGVKDAIQASQAAVMAVIIASSSAH